MNDHSAKPDESAILSNLYEAARKLYDIAKAGGYPQSTLDVYKRAIDSAEKHLGTKAS